MTNRRGYITGCGLLLGLSATLSSCAELRLHSSSTSDQSSSDQPSSDQSRSDQLSSAQPGGAASPSTPSSPETNPSSSSFAVLTAPALQPSAATARIPYAEDYACLTANYFVNITWQQEQPYMTFGYQPTEPLLQDEAATVTANADGSFTYEFVKTARYYTRIYPDRACLIQMVDVASNTATVEEAGKLGALVATRASGQSDQNGQNQQEDWLKQWTNFFRL